MKRLQIYIDEEQDEALGILAARTGTSKAALIRGFVADRLSTSGPQGDPLDDLVGSLDSEPGDVDDVVYGR
jgi:Ribbon-helix-helix protein, copG family